MTSIPDTDLAWGPEHRQHRFARSPVIRSGYDWFLKQKAEMIEAAFWYLQASGIRGDYLEFGVFEGMTFVQAWYASLHSQLPVRFHAFDSFCGLPEMSAQPDKEGPYEAGMFADGTRDVFLENLNRNQVDLNRVTITEGFFEDTLDDELAKRISLETAALVWIDCDLYSSSIEALNYVGNFLVDGSVLIFDDWFAFGGRSDRGEQLAFSQWKAANPQFRIQDYRTFGHLGKSFIVNRT